MTLASLLPLPVAIIIVGAVAAPLVARLRAKAALVVGMAATAGAAAVLVVVASRVYSGHGHVVTTFLSNERPHGGRVLGIAFAADPFGMVFALLAAGLGTLLLLALLSEFGELGPKELGAMSCLVLLLIGALVGAALTADTVNLFVWFEVASLSSYGLTGFFLERPIALEAAFKNVVLTTMAGFLVFAGAGMLYAITGALNFGQLHAAVGSDPTRAQSIAVALLAAGFATKAGLMPFHGWLPDAHTPVPGAISALFSALMVDLGVIALARVALLLFPSWHALRDLLTVLGLVSAVGGALLALVQDDLKRLLAWDTVSQTGLLVAGFSSRTAEGVTGAVYHLVNHGLFKALLFLCAGSIVHATGLTSIREMGGLARRRPLVTGAFVMGCLAIAGVPPLNGYASLGLIHEGLKGNPMAYGTALVAQAVTVAALARAAYLAFFRRRERPYKSLEPPRLGMRISLTTLAVCCVAFGIAADPFVATIAGPASSVLLHPARYAAAVLSHGGPVAVSGVSFHFFEPTTLLDSAGEIIVGLLLAAFVIKRETPRVLAPLRRLHTGSANDYAMFSAIGLVVSMVILVLV
jgi:multicomponent Na+:H+ antiporter subunit D